MTEPPIERIDMKTPNILRKNRDQKDLIDKK